VWRFAISDQRVDEKDPLFFHKTTRRQFYDREMERQKAASEAILTLADLARADRIYLGNSVRGLIRAEPLGIEREPKAARELAHVGLDS
jgi:branched-subunit amino acid aminotransferase/4-amino-4-deoxychorismate lyase